MITANELRIGNWVLTKDRDDDARYTRVENFEARAINWFTTSYTFEAEAWFLKQDAISKILGK